MQPSVLVPHSGVLASAASAIEVLLVRLGERNFGVSLGDVRYVAPMPVDYVSRGSGVADHFVFEGSPLTYVSLWDRLGQNSAYAEYEALLALLPQRRQDHLDWMAALEESLRSGASFAKARNPRDCAFGKWYYGYRSKDRQLELLLGQFEEPHVAIHGLADRLLGMAEGGDRAGAIAAFDEARHSTLAHLIELFDEAQMLARDLQRRIAIIVANGDETCALGADGVRDIVTVPAERLKSDKTGSVSSASTAGLLVLDDRNVVPLLNWQTFCA